MGQRNGEQATHLHIAILPVAIFKEAGEITKKPPGGKKRHPVVFIFDALPVQTPRTAAGHLFRSTNFTLKGLPM